MSEPASSAEGSSSGAETLLLPIHSHALQRGGEGAFKCDGAATFKKYGGCSIEKGSGERWRCADCKFDLCDNCVEREKARSKWVTDLPLEVDLQGFYETGFDWLNKKIVKYVFRFTKTNDSSVPLIHIKRIFLCATKQQFDSISDGDTSPISYLAECPAKLKKSQRQDEATAQSRESGKYRPQLLCDPGSSRTKWSAEAPKPDSPVVLTLTPKPPGTSFPIIYGWKFVQAIRSSRRPGAFTLSAVFEDGSERELDKVTSVTDQHNLGLAPTNTFHATTKFTELVASGDITAIVGALNCLPSRRLGFLSCEGLHPFEMLAGTANPKLFSLAVNQMVSAAVSLNDLISPQTMNEEHLDLVRRYVNAGFQPTLKTFESVIQKGQLGLLNFLLEVSPKQFFENENQIVAYATSGGYDMLNYVLNKLKTPPVRRVESLPAHPALDNPSADLLINSFKCADKRLFEEFFAVIDLEEMRKFFEALSKESPPRFPLNYLQQGLARGMRIEQNMRHDSLLYRAIEAQQWDAARLLLDHGAQFRKDTGRMVRHAFAKRKTGELLLLKEYGAPTPIWYLFSRLMREKDTSPERIASGLELLKALGFDVNGKGVDGCTPLEKAIQYQRFSLLGGLLAAGATINQGGKSLFATATDNNADLAGRLSLIPFATADDKLRLSETMVRALMSSKDINLLEALEKLIAAGADVNHMTDLPGMGLPGPCPLDVAMIPYRPEIYDFLRSKGAKPQKNSMVFLMAAVHQGMSREQFNRSRADIDESIGWDDKKFLVHLLLRESESDMSNELVTEYLANITDFSQPIELPALLPRVKKLPPKVPWLALTTKKGGLAMFKRFYEGGSRYNVDFGTPDEIVSCIQYSFRRFLKHNKGSLTAEDLTFLIDAHNSPHLQPETLAPQILNYIDDEIAMPVLISLLDREDLDPNAPILTPNGPPEYLLRKFLMVSRPSAEILDLLLRNGADVALAEGTGESFLAHVGKKFESPSEAQEKGIALFQQLLSRGASLQAKDDRNVPVPHSLAYQSGQGSYKRYFKKLFLLMLGAGLDINVGLSANDVKEMTLSSSSFTHFENATPRDFNYRANENLQRFFNKRSGVRRYR